MGLLLLSSASLGPGPGPDPEPIDVDDLATLVSIKIPSLRTDAGGGDATTLLALYLRQVQANTTDANVAAARDLNTKLFIAIRNDP